MIYSRKATNLYSVCQKNKRIISCQLLNLRKRLDHNKSISYCGKVVPSHFLLRTKPNICYLGFKFDIIILFCSPPPQKTQKSPKPLYNAGEEDTHLDSLFSSGNGLRWWNSDPFSELVTEKVILLKYRRQCIRTRHYISNSECFASKVRDGLQWVASGLGSESGLTSVIPEGT